MGHPEPKTITEPPINVNVSVNYNGATKFTDAVDMGEVPEGKYTPPPNEIDPTGMTNVTATTIQGAIAQLDNLVGSGSTAVEGLVSWRNALNETITITPQQINNLIFSVGNAQSTIPPGNYRVKAIVKCLMASGKNEPITIAFYKRNTLDVSPSWQPIAEEVTFNQAYLTTASQSYGVSNQPNQFDLEEVLALIEGDQIGVFINSDTLAAATLENSQLFYEKTAMAVNRFAGNFDI